MATKKEETPMLDPVAYRSDYNPNDIKEEYRGDPNIPWVWPQNANLNYQEYWDDSNPEWQSQRWWLNPKYEWEWVMNTYIEYDPNLRTSDLDPNYLYWENARQQNRQEAGYIARRNDQIASALYNEWLTSRADVENYLSQQWGWMNSTLDDRLNTIDSIWKRMGEITPKEESKEVDYSRLDNIRWEDTSWTIYWKTTADEWNPEEGIPALSDENSVFRMMEESRIAEVKSLLNMSTDTIATSLWLWINPVSETAMRDYQTQYPELWAEVQQKMKQMKGNENANAIAKWEEITTTADRTDLNTQNTNYAVNNSNLSVSATQLLKGIDSILDSSDTAKSAQELMWSLEADMAKLKNRMLNLKKEANTVFKWDAPDYLVKAYMNNRSQEIQNQLSILEDRYNAAYDRYKTELAHAEWQSEYELKKDSLALEDYIAKNWWTSTSTNNKNYTVAERNNNPLNMTVDFMKIVWAELGVDYEVSSDSFVNSNWGTQYYAKLIWDPVETTIRVLDKALENWVNPFTKTSWSYIDKLWLTKEKWQGMTHDEKVEMIKKWLPYEWWNMDNMAYYVNNPTYGTWTPELPEWRSYDWNNDIYTDYYRMTVEEWGKLSNQARQEVLAWFDWDYSKFLKKKKLFNEEVVKKEWQAQWLQVLRAIAQLYNDTQDESWNFETWWVWFLGFYPRTTIKDKFDQITNLLKLDKMIQARNNWVSFWQVTEWEWEIIENAASSMNWWRKDASIDKRLKETIAAVWHTTFWKEMTSEDWENFKKQQKEIDEWDNAVKQQQEEKLAQIWTWAVGTWIDFNKVITNWY